MLWQNIIIFGTKLRLSKQNVPHASSTTNSKIRHSCLKGPLLTMCHLGHYQLLKMIILNLNSSVLLAQLENIGSGAKAIRKINSNIVWPCLNGFLWNLQFFSIYSANIYILCLAPFEHKAIRYNKQQWHFTIFTCGQFSSVCLSNLIEDDSKLKAQQDPDGERHIWKESTLHQTINKSRKQKQKTRR